MSRKLVLVAAFALMLAIPSTASAGHGLKAWLKAYYDHPMPAFAPTVAAVARLQLGRPGRALGARSASIPTGNPHTDIDYFTQGGETFASVGTLAIGPNGGGQSIVQLTQNGAGHAVVAEVRRRASVGDVPEQPVRGARPPARRRGDPEGRRAAERHEPVVR